jgi:hypothetical protein
MSIADLYATRLLLEQQLKTMRDFSPAYSTPRARKAEQEEVSRSYEYLRLVNKQLGIEVSELLNSLK